MGDTDTITILFSKESKSTHVFGFFDGDIAVILEGDVFADASVNDTLDLTKFFGSHLLEV